MDTQQPPELIDEDMTSQDSAPISTPADIIPSAVFAGKPSSIMSVSVSSGVDIDMKDGQNIQAPPSPAPSGDDNSHHGTTLRPSPSPMSALSYSAGDHPETSIPSPASPSASDPLPVDPPVALATPKHEHSDDEGPDAMNDEDQRPAKRARTADVASPSPSSRTAVPPLPAMAAVPPPVENHSPQSHTTLSPQQFKFAQGVLRVLRKQKDAFPFLQAVDPVALNVPHYYSVITKPMDFGTIDRKLTASNPAKKVENFPASEPRYYSMLEFMADIKLVFDNCYTFNGPDHLVSQCAKRLQTLFEKQTKNMPPPQPPAPVFKAPTPVAAPPPRPADPVASTSKKQAAPRRPSTSVPTIRRTDTANASDFVSARPKREIHPPPPKDSGYDEQAPKRPAGPRVGKNGKRRKDDGTLDQLRFCAKIIQDLYKKQYSSFAQFFYDPVSEEYAPNYYKIIKKPMDMSTLKRNLDQKTYADANAFYDDFQLMISNCVRFNPVGTPVYVAGQDLAKAFNEKWRLLPPLRSPEPSDDEEEGEDAPDPNTLQHLEAQLASLRETIDGLKGGGKTKSKPKADAAKPSASRQASTSYPAKASGSAAPTPRRPAPKKGGSKKGAAAQRRTLDADAQLSFEEKKELSETIQNLEGPELEEVIQIIHEGVPDIGDNTDEIEIEIDALPPAVLRALWNAVIKPKQPPPPPAAAAKPFKSGRNQAGTGGLKRKSMDENAEAEKMRLLEQRISMFDAVTSAGGAAAAGPAAAQGSAATVQNPAGDADSTHSSDSESDSGSSSDSD